jgi:hypothetical protein
MNFNSYPNIFISALLNYEYISHNAKENLSNLEGT